MAEEEAPDEEMTVEEKLAIERQRAGLLEVLVGAMEKDRTKFVDPIKDDEVLVIMCRDTTALGKMDQMIKKLSMYQDERLIIALDKQMMDVWVCKKDQVAYTRDRRVIIKPPQRPAETPTPPVPTPGGAGSTSDSGPTPVGVPEPKIDRPTLGVIVTGREKEGE